MLYLKAVMQRPTVVSFGSVGGDEDDGKAMNFGPFLEAHKDFHVRVYTPSILRSAGYKNHAKMRAITEAMPGHPGLAKIGSGAWKPLIILLELAKLSDGELLIYKDIDCSKYPGLCDTNNLEEIAREALRCGFVEYDYKHLESIDDPLVRLDIKVARAMTLSSKMRTFWLHRLFECDLATKKIQLRCMLNQNVT